MAALRFCSSKLDIHSTSKDMTTTTGAVAISLCPAVAFGAENRKANFVAQSQRESLPAGVLVPAEVRAWARIAVHFGMDPISRLSSINSAAGIGFAESLGTSRPAESCEGWVGATWLALGWLKLPLFSAIGSGVSSRFLGSALRSVPERQRQNPIVEQADMIATEQQSRCQ